MIDLVTDIGGFLYSTATSPGGNGVLWLILNGLVSAYFFVRVNGAVSHVYGERMERLKTELKKSADSEVEIFKGQVAEVRAASVAATAAFAAAHSATTSKRIAAVEQLWLRIVKTKEECVRLVAGFEAMDLASIEARVKQKNPVFVEGIRRLDKESLSFFESANVLESEVNRLYVDEETWMRCQAYRLFLVRVVYVWRDSLVDGRPLHWRDDPVAQSLYSDFLSKEKVQEIKRLSVNVLSVVASAAENGILQMARAWISGRLAADMAIEEANRIRKLAESEMLKMPPAGAEVGRNIKKDQA